MPYFRHRCFGAATNIFEMCIAPKSSNQFLRILVSMMKATKLKKFIVLNHWRSQVEVSASDLFL
ncbi:hypothetical protein AAKU67_002806 [Oxalobacteraceae bacterium GrIS 2.11]